MSDRSIAATITQALINATKDLIFAIRHGDGAASWSEKIQRAESAVNEAEELLKIQEAGAKLQAHVEEVWKESTCVLPAPFVQRLNEELGQLKERLGKLDTFISTSPVFGGLPQAEQDRLMKQSVVMDEYRQILEERIEAMKSTETS